MSRMSASSFASRVYARRFTVMNAGVAAASLLQHIPG